MTRRGWLRAVGAMVAAVVMGRRVPVQVCTGASAADAFTGVYQRKRLARVRITAEAMADLPRG